MSAFIGSVGNSSERAVAEVWCSLGGVEIHKIVEAGQFGLDPIAARNFAALLVRAADEVERMRVRYAAEHPAGLDGVCRKCGVVHQGMP